MGVKHPLEQGPQKQFAIEYARRLQAWLGGPERPVLDKLLEDGWGETVEVGGTFH